MVKQTLFIVLFIIISASLCFSQKEMVVADLETKQILAFAEVNFGRTGVYSDRNGVFIVPSDTIKQYEITYLGYEKIKIKAYPFNQDTIFMHPTPLLLDEVIISGSVTEKEIDFLKIEKKYISSFPVQKSREIVTRIFPKKEIAAILKKVYFSFDKIQFKKEKNRNSSHAIVRFNIYTNDSSLALIYSSTPIEIEAYKKDRVSIDISIENINLTSKGLAFGVEYIGHIDRYGKLLQIADEVRPNLVSGDSDDYEQATFIRSVFDKKSVIIPSLEEYFKETTPSYYKGTYKRNLAIAFTLFVE